MPIVALLSLVSLSAGAADLTPGSDAFCSAMMDHADEIWPLDQVQKCAPWRKRRLDQLSKAASDCRAAHAGDLDHLDACDKENDAATRFWQESEYVENNRDVPPDQANRVIRQSP
jgi:hypothetical protein